MSPERSSDTARVIASAIRPPGVPPGIGQTASQVGHRDQVRAGNLRRGLPAHRRSPREATASAIDASSPTSSATTTPEAQVRQLAIRVV